MSLKSRIFTNINDNITEYCTAKAIGIMQNGYVWVEKRIDLYYYRVENLHSAFRRARGKADGG